MAASYYDLLLRHLWGTRRALVEGLMGTTPPTPEHLREVADVQQAITAVEAVIAENDIASGVIPMRKV